MKLGFDEVGRGALAGPVVTGLIGLSDDFPLKIYKKSDDSERIIYQKYSSILAKSDDSKKLKPAIRKQVVDLISELSIPAVVLKGSNKAIDEYGIGKVLSHLLSLSLDVFAWRYRPAQGTKVIVDGRIKPSRQEVLLYKKLLYENGLPETGFGIADDIFSIMREDKADSTYLSVALASNIAKVERDIFMLEQSLLYPEYGWSRNVGYGTKEHRAAIAKNPHNHLLRTTWLTKIVV